MERREGNGGRGRELSQSEVGRGGVTSQELGSLSEIVLGLNHKGADLSNSLHLLS